MNFATAMVGISAELGWHPINEWTSTAHLFMFLEAHGTVSCTVKIVFDFDY